MYIFSLKVVRKRNGQDMRFVSGVEEVVISSQGGNFIFHAQRHRSNHFV